MTKPADDQHDEDSEPRIPWDAARWYPGLWNECPDCEGTGAVDRQRCEMCGGMGGWSD